MPGLEWIQLSQLVSLGIRIEWIYFVMVFLVIFIFYQLLKPIVYMFVTMQSTKILSYIIGSLLVMLGTLVLTILSEASLVNLLKVVFESLAAFGGLLFVIRTYQILTTKRN